jgi:hypothetical protein
VTSPHVLPAADNKDRVRVFSPILLAFLLSLDPGFLGVPESRYEPVVSPVLSGLA